MKRGCYRYIGWKEQVERRADNSGLWQQRLKSAVSRKERAAIQKELELYRDFPPDQPLARAVFHQVEVYRFTEEIHWQEPPYSQKGTTRPRLKIAVGQLELALMVDFSQELALLSGETAYQERTVGCNVLYELGQGRFIRGGTIVEKVVNEQSRLVAARKYLEINFDAQNQWYGFNLAVAQLRDRKEYPIIKVTSVTTFNGLKVESLIEYARPKLHTLQRGKARSLFSTFNDKVQPQVRWHYVKY